AAGADLAPRRPGGAPPAAEGLAARGGGPGPPGPDALAAGQRPGRPPRPGRPGETAGGRTRGVRQALVRRDGAAEAGEAEQPVTRCDRATGGGTIHARTIQALVAGGGAAGAVGAGLRGHET